MFNVDDTTIMLTRGDIATIEISAIDDEGSSCNFQSGDVVRLMVFEKKHHDRVVLNKEITIENESSTASIFLSSEDTRIGGVINKPVDYWYEIEVNPETAPQTIVGYDEDGAKIFRLYPEGDDNS